MNDLQRCQLSILQEFLSVCEMLGLRYYLVCGSALGAAKYGGFIPWDDDIDAALPREDYEAFLEKAPALFPGHLFLQNYHSDPAFPQIYSKLRHSGTTCIEENAAHLPIHHGIGMDIFPLDGYPEGTWAQHLLELKKKGYLHLLATAYAPPKNLRSRLEYRIKRLLGIHRHAAKIAAGYDALLRKCPAETSEIWCNHGNWQGRQEYMPQSWYGEGLLLPFEGLDVRVPKEIHAYLTQKYGDYTADPPKEAQKSHHRFAVVDCEKPYREYIGNRLPRR